MSEDEVLALARLAGIAIDPAHMPGVKRNLEILLDQATLLAAAGVAQEIEPAPVYRP